MSIKGKIYRIISPSNPELPPYYGSTKQKYLSNRLARHREGGYSSKHIIDKGDAIIELVEEYSCESKQELLLREKWWIENNDCINLRFPIHTTTEYIELKKQQSKSYYERNKEKMKEDARVYRANNKEIIKEKDRVRRLNKKRNDIVEDVP